MSAGSFKSQSKSVVSGTSSRGGSYNRKKSSGVKSILKNQYKGTHSQTQLTKENKQLRKELVDAKG